MIRIKRSRDSRFTYGKTVLSAQAWKDINSEEINYITNYKHSITPILILQRK